MSEQRTKKQHFIPRMILKHHTYFQIPMKKPIIFQYDKEKDCCRSVDIYDICRKNNLYEFRNEDGTIKESIRNSIENALSFYESRWDVVINKILNYENLTKEDIALLYLLFALQILSLPGVQKLGSQVYKEFAKNSQCHYTQTDIENWIKFVSLPTGLIGDEQMILKYFFEKFAQKKLLICDTEDVLAINGDFPIAIYPNNYDCDFPIASHFCLRLRGKHWHKDYVHLSTDEVKQFNNYIIKTCNGRFIYSSVPYDQIIKGD